MGLFDALQFDPSSYSGQGGGLLDFLKQYASLPGAGVGQFNPRTLQPDSTMPVGNYQMPVFGQADPAQLPMNSAPTQGQLPQAPQQPQPQQSQQTLPTFLQSQGGFNGFVNGMRSGGLMGGIQGVMGNGPDDLARQNLTAQYQALIPIFKQAGDDDRTAQSKAMLSVMNPEAGKQILTDQFGPGRYSMQMRTNDDGTQSPVVIDNKSGSVNFPGGGAASGVTSSAGQFGVAAPQPPPPPGVNVKSYREGIAKNAADEAADTQSKAEGAVTALQNFQRLKDRITAADPRAFGPIAGSDTGQYFNSLGGAIGGTFGDPLGDQKKAEQQSELSSLYKDVGSAMLKARFGSRVTNIDTKIGQQIVGGLAQPNKEAALKTLDNNISEAYDTLAQGIKRGVVDPHQVLQRPQTAEQAKALGSGALYIAPDGSVRRNPK